jgi:hypothetical protein
MSTPAFAEQSGKFMETMLAAQKTVRENMRAYLESINVPTREDIARLGELIVGLEEKIDQLDDRLGSIEQLLIRQVGSTRPAGGDSSPAPSAPRGATRARKGADQEA